LKQARRQLVSSKATGDGKDSFQWDSCVQLESDFAALRRQQADNVVVDIDNILRPLLELMPVERSQFEYTDSRQ
jgi:hypothetical protein